MSFRPISPLLLRPLLYEKIISRASVWVNDVVKWKIFHSYSLDTKKTKSRSSRPRVFFYCFFWRLTSVWLFSMLEKFPINLSESASARAFNYVFVSAYTRWECRRILNTFFFLVGAKRLYTRPRRSVGWLVGWSVGWSVFIFFFDIFITFKLLQNRIKVRRQE